MKKEPTKGFNLNNISKIIKENTLKDFPKEVLVPKEFLVTQDNISSVLADTKKALKQPSLAQLEARKLFGERAKARAIATKTAKIGATSDLNTKDEYSLEVRANDKNFNCKTIDLDGALKELGNQLGRLKTRMIISIKRNSKVRDFILPTPRAKRIFTNAFSRRVFVNNLHRYFK
jgi:hypothetical protein